MGKTVVGSELKRRIEDPSHHLVWNLRLCRSPKLDRHVSFDVTVGKVTVPDGGGLASRQSRREFGHLRTAKVVPQGLVVIESLESVNLPANMMAIAHPKTSLCERGLLILNTGIVDPNYNGKLKGTAINFSKRAIIIREGDPFLRLTFHEIDEATDQVPEFRESEDLADRYPHEFLNVTRHIRRAISAALWKWAALIAIVLAILLVVPPVTAEFFGSQPRMDDLVQQVNELEKEVRRVNGSQIDARGPQNTSPARIKGGGSQ